MLYFWWGCRRNLKLTILGSERVKVARCILSQSCTRKTELALELRFHLEFHRATWWWPLNSGSDLITCWLSDHFLYVLVNSYLLQRPALELREVPLFYTLFNSSSMQVRRSQNVHSPNLFEENCISEVVRIGSIIIFHLSKLWKAKFSILCGVIFLVGLQEKFDVDHSWERKG